MRLRWTRRTRWIAVAVVIAVLLGGVGWFWVGSFLPGTYSVMSMGYPDPGGGLPPMNMADMPAMPNMPGQISVADLTDGETAAPDVDITLVARQESVRLASGQRVAGYTLNHQSPGPTIVATQGDLLQVTLINESVKAGVTLHWHGVDVPNADDGVAGVTQDAVPIGGRFVYRFRLNDAGTYWYHSHQDSHVQIPGGLYGALIVQPKVAVAPAAHDVIAALHTYGKLRTVNGSTGVQRIDVPAGTLVRARVIDTDSDAAQVAVTGAAFRVVAIDGHDVNQPTDITRKSVVVPAGGRIDFTFTVPDGVAVRVDLSGGAALAIGPAGSAEAAVSTGVAFGTLDLLSYGSPAPLGFDPSHPDRRFDYRIGQRYGFVDGTPCYCWTVNGHLYPDVPMFEVNEGDIVVMTISNNTGMNHPIHLHGHHAVVLSRDGVPATGSPWWVDSLNVDGSTYVIAFLADNPGIWMDHCHNLPHAADGLVTHLAYIGVTEPYRIGGPAKNHPE